ncbi:MAG TPA: hypothetical protein VKF37_05200 [Chloroflexota bacterium]|nr:hypothetical protein [Chloroflexota bacterium]
MIENARGLGDAAVPVVGHAVAGQLPHEGARLWLSRRDYQSGSDTPSLRRGYTALALGVILATVYCFGGVLGIHRQLHHPVVIRTPACFATARSVSPYSRTVPSSCNVL